MKDICLIHSQCFADLSAALSQGIELQCLLFDLVGILVLFWVKRITCSAKLAAAALGAGTIVSDSDLLVGRLTSGAKTVGVGAWFSHGALLIKIGLMAAAHENQ